MSYPTYSDLELEIQNLEEENKKLKEEGIKNSKLYWDLMKGKEEYVEKRKMSNWKNNLNIGKVKKLEEENRKLKSDLAYERTMLDNVRAEYESLQNDIKKIEEERDFFKEQAILWRKDWKVAYEEKRKLEDRVEELETDYDRLKVAFEDVVSGK